jgi:hypothetical protein
MLLLLAPAPASALLPEAAWLQAPDTVVVVVAAAAAAAEFTVDSVS